MITYPGPIRGFSAMSHHLEYCPVQPVGLYRSLPQNGHTLPTPATQRHYMDSIGPVVDDAADTFDQLREVVNVERTDEDAALDPIAPHLQVRGHPGAAVVAGDIVGDEHGRHCDHRQLRPVYGSPCSTYAASR